MSEGCLLQYHSAAWDAWGGDEVGGEGKGGFVKGLRLRERLLWIEGVDV